MMDPVAVMKLLWRYRYALLPVALLTLGVMAYVFQFAPRAYESSMSVAIVNPNVPTEADKQADPSLVGLNADNPYLRSSDPSLIAQAVVARLDAVSTAQELEAAGLGKEYKIGRGSAANGFMVEITGIGLTEAHSLATTRALGAQLERELGQIQKVDGADDRYLFTPIVVTEPMKATEQFSSRLRSLILVLLGGGVLGFGAISAARAVDVMRQKKQTGTTATGVASPGVTEPEETTAIDSAAVSSPNLPDAQEQYQDSDVARRDQRGPHSRTETELQMGRDR